MVPETTVPFKLLNPAILDFTTHDSWIIAKNSRHRTTMLQVNPDEINLCNQKSHTYRRRHKAYVSGGPAPTGRSFISWGFCLFHRGLSFLNRPLVLLKFQIERGQHTVDPALSLSDCFGLIHPKTKHKEVAWRDSLVFILVMEKKPFFLTRAHWF